MKNRVALWAILITALTLLAVNFGGSAGSSHKMTKVGGEKSHCDCSYRID
ncbi:MAG TPA: hypothetical protein VMM37_00450 [Bacteroidota bacterium]|nr:hypothetical protein [Bacteroidota bacterium]